MAVGQRFELWDLLQSTVFKTAAFDHSATPPEDADYTWEKAWYKSKPMFLVKFTALLVRLPFRFLWCLWLPSHCEDRWQDGPGFGVYARSLRVQMYPARGPFER